MVVALSDVNVIKVMVAVMVVVAVVVVNEVMTVALETIIVVMVTKVVFVGFVVAKFKVEGNISHLKRVLSSSLI